MSQKVRINKRQQAAAAKRAAIIGSAAFQTWWTARQTFYPIPSDPYRAFMIDKGLFARVHHKEVWQHRTNRMDYPPVDLPLGVPSPKRRLPPRKQIKRFKKRPKAAQPLPITPFEKELIGRVEQFTEKYHLPSVEVRIEPRRQPSYMHPLFGKGMILMPKEFVARGAKLKGVREQVESVIFHEAGHHAHVAYGYAIQPDLASAIATPYPKATRIEKERIAWAVAKKHLRKEWSPIMGWGKKVWLGTYIGTTPLSRIIREPKKRKRR